MKAALRRAWESRAPRERMVIAALAAVLGVASYVLVVHSAERGRRQLSASVDTLRATPAPAVSPTDLRALVQARVDAAGLSRALTRLDAPDADHVRVTLGAVSFAHWLDWIAALQSQNVLLESARVEALSAPGMVSATATLTRARAP
jgi:general secretion pathway protein M